jgi:hypothetical protein
MTTAAKKIKTVASVFELPQKLGILQYVEYEPLRGSGVPTTVSMRGF